MNYVPRYVLMIAVVLVSTACKKDPPVPPVPGTKSLAIWPKWTFYNKANGFLPDNQVNAIAVDKNGTKWVGTAKGLVRIGEASATTYDTNNCALLSSMILSVATDDRGNVWTGTDHGLSVFNGTVWKTYTTDNSLLKDNTVKCLAYDNRHRTLWAGTDNGIIKITEDKPWEHIEEEFVILSMATDREGALWLGLFDAFAFRGVIEKQEKGVSEYYRLDKEGYASAFPYALAVDEHNRILAALGGTVVKTVIRLEAGAWNDLGCPQNMYGLRAMALSGPEIWIGGKGVCLLSDKNPQVIAIPGNASSVLSMATDREGRKWLGTFDEGLAVYNENGFE